MPVRQVRVTTLLALVVCMITGCGKMVVVGEVDGGAGDRTETSSEVCSWQTGITGPLNAVWGDSADNVLVVGGETAFSSIAKRYNGESWASLPDHGAGYLELRGVWGIEDDLFVVGDFILLKYDGVQWIGALTLPLEIFSGVWPISSTNAIVVGGFDSAYIAEWLVNIDLTVVPGLSGGLLRDVWGSSTGNIYAVGDSGTILRFNGLNWDDVDIGYDDLAQMWFAGVWGTSSNNVYVVGRHALGGPVLLRFDGDQWFEIDINTVVDGAALRGVHGTSPDNVWIVGEQQGDGIVLQNDGSGWLKVDHQFTFPLNDVWVAQTGEVFTVGDSGAVYCTY